jgi:hypothetical protein
VAEKKKKKKDKGEKKKKDKEKGEKKPNKVRAPRVPVLCL